MAGNWLLSLMVLSDTSVPGNLNWMISGVAVPLAAALVKASRSVPGPVSALLVTINVAPEATLQNKIDISSTKSDNFLTNIDLGNQLQNTLFCCKYTVNIILIRWWLYNKQHQNSEMLYGYLMIDKLPESKLQLLPRFKI